MASRNRAGKGEFFVRFEWVDPESDQITGSLEMDGPQWDRFFSMANRLSPEALDKLARMEVTTIPIEALADEPYHGGQVFLTIGDFIDSLHKPHFHSDQKEKSQ
jgi:hypothetical protein